MPRPRLGDEPMTSAKRQARRREQFRLMREAWDEVLTVKTAKRAHEIAERVIAAVDGAKATR